MCSDHIHLYRDEHVSEAVEIRKNVLILCTEKIQVCVCPEQKNVLIISGWGRIDRQAIKGVLETQGLFTFLD